MDASRNVAGTTSLALTSHGERIAELKPLAQPTDGDEARKRKAWEVLKKRLESQPALDLPRVTRDEMHER